MHQADAFRAFGSEALTAYHAFISIVFRSGQIFRCLFYSLLSAQKMFPGEPQNWQHSTFFPLSLNSCLSSCFVSIVGRVSTTLVCIAAAVEIYAIDDRAKSPGVTHGRMFFTVSIDLSWGKESNDSRREREKCLVYVRYATFKEINWPDKENWLLSYSYIQCTRDGLFELFSFRSFSRDI